MNRNFIAVTGVVVAFAGTVAAQTITVLGTGDPKVDIPAVQAAVDQGGRVVLKGHFSFDAPPTVAEQPSILFSAAPLGTILISKAVVISGALDDQGEMSSIEGGTNPFYVEAPGSQVTIQGLHCGQEHPPGSKGHAVSERGDRPRALNISNRDRWLSRMIFRAAGFDGHSNWP